jgi:hypothetical protein
MREHQLLSVYCGDTLIDVWGEAMSMDDITDYRIADTDISVLEMIYSLDKEGKFETHVREEMYDHVSRYGK